MTKFFKVVSVSRTTNSFGLRGMVLVARDGEAWEVAANYLHVRAKGDIVRVPMSDVLQSEPDWAKMGYEIPTRLPNCPAKALAEVFPMSKGGVL